MLRDTLPVRTSGYWSTSSGRHTPSMSTRSGGACWLLWTAFQPSLARRSMSAPYTRTPTQAPKPSGIIDSSVCRRTNTPRTSRCGTNSDTSPSASGTRTVRTSRRRAKSSARSIRSRKCTRSSSTRIGYVSGSTDGRPREMAAGMSRGSAVPREPPRLHPAVQAVAEHRKCRLR